ncbi:Y-family DNA polymerase [Adhaeribacter rhizoryzae]|uniref:Y-family DNA polymerase n=1 Tax=Adhaeribacter rhizoryzae TaxID=2607907 RepID=A0A5M6DQ55_9BACT|nr:Y-family DNA polymerase [Adhaeribacter rhizoryzae]KAA5548359.1 Y-family DNA polymerase [Adhaeribacter rhizoryzae]
MTNLFALVDCNNFYVRCETLFRPDLLGKPVVVLSNNDGCVISRSQEVKDLGIKMGTPFFVMKELIQQQGITYFSSNYELYGDMSLRVVETLRTFSPNVEVYSVDESFLDLGDFKFIDLPAYARNIKETLYQNLGLPVCVGVAPTKTLAKIANRLAKKSKKAEGCLILTDPYHIEEALKRTAVEDVWGVGRQYAKFLESAGIKTAYELRNTTDAWIKKHCSVVMLRTVKELRGEPCVDLELNPADKQNICTSRSFGKPVAEFDALLEATTSYAAKCAYKLRKQNSCAKELVVFVTTNRFADTIQYFNSQKIKLPTATNSDLELIRYTRQALESIYKPGYQYKKTGVVVMDIVPEKNVQLNLLDTTDHAKEQTLMHFLDDLTAKFGKDTVKVACQGTKQKKGWNLNREFLSPCYTTRFQDILTIII